MPFGGEVKLTGESEYRRAIQAITQDLGKMSSELKKQASDFNANDKSMRNTAQQQKALNDALKQQQEELAKAKNAYAQYSVALQTQQQRHNALSREYNNAVKELDKIGKEVGETSEEYKKQQKVVDDLGQELADSNKEMNESKSAMSSLKKEINDSQKVIDTTTKEMEELGKETKKSGDKAKDSADKGWTPLKQILADLGTSAIKSALSGMQKLGGAFISVGKQALDSYAEYEQLVGGVETLFKDSASIVEGYANDAYKTSGLSANEYMQQVTSFSASLINSLDGDTAKASEVANRAIIDMSDNANKMGTDIGMIQNAYQGFAKQNYTMLDNLKLGYGGTKEEMKRLLADAEKMPEAMGRKFDLNNYADVVDAIHVVQEHMGIAGTTAKEASTTIQGSSLAMKSAWQNMLTGMADDNANFDQLINNLVDSVMTFADNIMPRVQTIISGMGKAIPQLLEKLVPEIIKTVPPLLEESLPLLVTAIQSMIESLLDVAPQIITAVTNLIPQIVSALLSMIPQVMTAGYQIITGLIEGIGEAIPELLTMMPEIISQIVDVMSQGMPDVIGAGIGLIQSLIEGILLTIPELIAKFPEMFSQLLSTILSQLPLILTAGGEIILSLIQGITDTIPQLIAMLPEIINSTVETLTSMLPEIIDTGIEVLLALIDGLVEAIPQLVDMLPTIIDTIINVLMQNLPLIINAGMKILIAVIQGLTKALPQLIGMVPQIISSIVTTLTRNLPQILSMGAKILMQLISGILKSLPQLVSSIGQLGMTIIREIGKLPSKMLDIGKNLVKGLWNGISDMTSWVIGKIKGFGDSVLGGIKKFFGISSPSKLFEDEVGVYLAQGIGEGFSDEMKNVTKQMENSIPHSFDTNLNVSGQRTGSNGSMGYYAMVDAFKEALSEMKIELDDDQVGRFIDKTVTRLVYN